MDPESSRSIQAEQRKLIACLFTKDSTFPALTKKDDLNLKAREGNFNWETYK